MTDQQLPHPYVTAVEIPEEIAYDQQAAAQYGFTEWFRRADEIGFIPHIVAGTCHLKLHMRTDRGKHWLHVSGPVLDPPAPESIGHA